jgi:nucleoside-diphosphate-sugar epimerase
LKALVTGGAGLIGSHIVDLLHKKGLMVRILDNLRKAGPSPKKIRINCQFFNRDKL